MNPKIQKAWDTGLNILKPGEKELAHGLELHKNSLVVESYGFTPLAPLRGEGLYEKFKNAHPSEYKLIESDARSLRCIDNPEDLAEFKEAWDTAGVTCVITNSGGGSPASMLKRMACRTHLTDMMKDFIVKAVSADDILQVKKTGKHSIMFTTNGIPLPMDLKSAEDELSLIKLFYQFGIRMMHLTYNRHNLLGDGCAEKNNSGLTDFGKVVINEMNKTGILVDVAHSGWQTSLEAARASSVPVVASHSGCASVNSHCRSKPDEVIRAIADTGGFIGICCIPAFLGKTGDINSLLDHIDYAAEKFGVDHLAIGTDVIYSSGIPDDERITAILKNSKDRPRFDYFWSSDDALFDQRWKQKDMLQSLEWTNFPLFTVGLVQRGYSDSDIQKIIGGNVLRVLKAVETRKV
ncbi:MAG: hypothetical protein A2096_17655 [Spirochaetes bacterium GWF1_41_5]|nr:MAG: hypothetical protein A2096_17655 [Spirochaetes bacterium GWF1_41_5]HBE02373.1 dipeptidase [Spirochaetia bacterium]